VDGEDNADTRRLLRGRGIDDRWRRIDRRRVVAIVAISTTTVIAMGSSIPAAPVIPAAVASIVISGERRRDGYTADH
jgi:hypothetical protein